MKITEIVEPKHRTRRIKAQFDAPAIKRSALKRIEPVPGTTKDEIAIGAKNQLRQYKKSKSREEHLGAMSTYTPNPFDPHMGRITTTKPTYTDYKTGKPKTKSADQGLHRDPKYTWFQIAAQNWQHNTYYPRIYETEVVVDELGREKPRYYVENLMVPKDFRPEMMLDLYYRIFPSKRLRKGEQLSSTEVWQVLISELGEIMKGNKPISDIDDENLREVVIKIQELLQSDPNFELDFHINNAMVRGTPYGPQLVITDPIHVEEMI